MFSKFTQFWIKNGKITMMFVIVVLIWGIFSWSFIPKQYNPDIVVPAFEIIIPAPGFSSQEVKNLIVDPFENKLNEIEGVEHIYSVANRDYAAFMLMYYVGTDKEKATTRLYNKINSNIDLKPLGVNDPIIKSVDPDDLPVYSFAVSSNKTGDEVMLRKIGVDILEKLKLSKDISVMYMAGGEKENINIKLDLNKLEAKNVDVLQVYNVLKKNNISFPGGDMIIDQSVSEISVDGNLNDTSKVKKLLVSYLSGSPVYLEDIAFIYKGISDQKYFTYFGNKDKLQNAIHLGIAKKKGSNSVFLVENIKKELEKIKQNLPSGYEIHQVQDEGYTASEATNTLLEELIKSIIVLFIVLFLFLGFKDAISSSFSIPLVLAITFGIGLIIGDNINRITLFALILVLGMLVDDSIIVVENISRHLQMYPDKSKFETIVEATGEIAAAAFFSTITKIMSFIGMFFVGGMMGQYMGPIPKYAIIALSTSLLIAFSVNPFFSYFFYKNKVSKKEVIKQSSNDSKDPDFEYVSHHETFLEKFYSKIMGGLLGEKFGFRRKLIKYIFWISLLFIIVIPPTLGIFKMRMLPKSNKEQIYLWINLPRSSDISISNKFVNQFDGFIKQYYHFGEDKSKGLDIIKDISYNIGNSPIPDFANLFRGSNQRQGDHFISMRINLIPVHERNIDSEQFVIQIRPIIQKFINENYPQAQMRLLEDPPGPPVKATFMIELKSNDSSYHDLENLADYIKQKIYPTIKSCSLEDVYTSSEKYKTNYVIKLDHESISRSLLDNTQVSQSIYNIFKGSTISVYHNDKTKEPINIFLGVEKDQKNNLDILKKITFTNSLGNKIPLTEISHIEPTTYDNTIYTDDRNQTVYIYGEMGNNSVIYPVISMFRIFLDKNFWNGKYEIVSWNPYGVRIKELFSGNEVSLMFGGERKLTVDTFKDLGSALILTLLALYFLVSARFGSFSLGGIIMLSFLLGLFGIMPGFSLLFILKNEYFSATAMIGVIALAGIVIGNAIILLEYYVDLKAKGFGIKESLMHAGVVRLRPILLTSITAILGAIMIVGDPVWSGLAWSIVWGLSASAILTLIIIPIFVYDSDSGK